MRKKANQVQPSRLVKMVIVSIRGHPLPRRVCASVTHGVAFQAIKDLQNLIDPDRKVLFVKHHSWTLHESGDDAQLRQLTRCTDMQNAIAHHPTAIGHLNGNLHIMR